MCRHPARRGVTPAPPGHPLTLSRRFAQPRGTCANGSFKKQWTQVNAQWAVPAAPSKGSTEAPGPEVPDCQMSPHPSPRLHARSLASRRAPRDHPPPSLSCPQQPWNTHCSGLHTLVLVDYPTGPPQTLFTQDQPWSSSASARPGSHLSVCPLPPALACPRQLSTARAPAHWEKASQPRGSPVGLSQSPGDWESQAWGRALALAEEAQGWAPGGGHQGSPAPGPRLPLSWLPGAAPGRRGCGSSQSQTPPRAPEAGVGPQLGASCPHCIPLDTCGGHSLRTESGEAGHRGSHHGHCTPATWGSGKPTTQVTR